MGLEVTRDGKGIREHSARALPIPGHLQGSEDHGRYAPLMHAQVNKVQAIADLRSPSANAGHQAAPRVAHPHLYTVLFSEDFKKATIYHQDSEDSAQVAGDAGQEIRGVLMAQSLAASPSGTI